MAPTWSDEGCYCGHGPYHHEGGDWPVGPINGRCRERGCDCSEFQRNLTPNEVSS